MGTLSLRRALIRLTLALSVNIMRIFWEVFLRSLCSRQEKSAAQKVLRKPSEAHQKSSEKFSGIFCIYARSLKSKRSSHVCQKVSKVPHLSTYDLFTKKTSEKVLPTSLPNPLEA